MLNFGHQHAVCISLGLEAHVFGMTHKDFFDIIMNDTAGPNKDVAKAEKIRTFLIPDRLIVPGSSSTQPRTVKIFGAFISSDWVHLLSDFTGLARMFVKSKRIPWTCDDLVPGSKVSFVSSHFEFKLISFSTGIPSSITSKEVLIGA